MQRRRSWGPLKINLRFDHRISDLFSFKK